MSYNFRADGSFTIIPLSGMPSADFSECAALAEALVLAQKHVDTVPLTVDSPVALSFGGVTNAHVVLLKAVGGKVRFRVTSADGSAQSVPTDSILFLMSTTVPITAIDATRVTGQPTSVNIFLGEKA